MPLSPKLPTADLSPALLQEVARVAVLPAVRGAFADFLSHEAQLADWQQQLAKIPAPPFGEQLRSEWMLERFLELGLEQVRTDEAANVFGIRPAIGNRYVALSAHIDTVFPAGTPLNVRQQGSRLYGPGVSDNAAGVVAMLGIAAAISRSRVRHTAPILFVANVGEEGEGDLRGMRHIFADSHWLDSIAFNLVLDGAGNDTIVAEALGSRRFEVIVRGPGGHSWSDFGAPNPIVVLARAIESFRQTPLPVSPKTTFNIGVIRGGTSVNSIPESASMRVDIRSTSTAEIERLERALRSGLDIAVANETKAMSQSGKERALGLSAEVVTIGDRPGGELPPEARILQVIRSVDAHLGNVAQVQRASTDANIPLSLGREAIAIGGGGTGGGAHTLQEWFDCTGRDFGLKRILLTLLALTGVSE
jgi:tripeptide aminopeptidase